MTSVIRPFLSRDLRLLESIIKINKRPRSVPIYVQPCLSIRPNHISIRGAKTTTRKKVKELQQGAIQPEPLPELEPDDGSPENPQYPTVLQGVRNNMDKFENCVVITRVGNFYELYFEHAEEYGPLLNLKVAQRASRNNPPVAMAGFPFWQLDRFLKILVQDLNKYVAISEEFPVNVTGKVKSNGLLFDRKIARIVTPGTLIDEKFLDPYQNNFLLSVHIDKPSQVSTAAGSQSSTTDQSIGLAWLDLTTGEFLTHSTTRTMLASALARIGAREIVLPEHIPLDVKTEVQTIVGLHHDLLTFYKPEKEFESMTAWNNMLDSPVQPKEESEFSVEEKLAGHQLLDYVQRRLQDLKLQLQPPRRRQIHQILCIDRNSLRGLEIVETARDGFGKGSLFHAVRRTATKSGARLLRDRLTTPSASLNEINDRLDMVVSFFESDEVRELLVMRLKRTFDVQRIVQKFTLNKGDADDMLLLAKSIDEYVAIHRLLSEALVEGSQFEIANKSPIQKCLAKFNLDGCLVLVENILNAIDEEGLNKIHRQEEDEAAEVASAVEEAIMSTAPEEIDLLPKKARGKSQLEKQKDQESDAQDTWIMRKDATETLHRLHDDLDTLRDEKRALETHLQQSLEEKTLMLKWSPGLGHFCHIRSGNPSITSKLEKIHARVVSASKSTRSFYLTDWTRLGTKIEQTKLHIQKEESRLFNSLRLQVIHNLVPLRRNASVIDELDVSTSFATLASEENWTRPRLNDSMNHKILGGRHPTVKLGLEEQGRSFVSNDLILESSSSIDSSPIDSSSNGERIWIITGPNMGGKSTFLRQNALITILAQAGSYVPAEYAELGIVDQIFSRIGAADDLFRDQSTFMVEMLETAAILRHATPRSFVIMDEVGRGTTPEDGTAVGFASLHHLHHVNRCRTLFATHFHALADMTEHWDGVGRYCTDILEEENNGSFVFLHRLKKGVNRQSHALKVARLAGLPEPAIKVAESVLKAMEVEKQRRTTNENQGTVVMTTRGIEQKDILLNEKIHDRENEQQQQQQQPLAASG